MYFHPGLNVASDNGAPAGRAPTPAGDSRWWRLALWCQRGLCAPVACH